MHVSQRILSVYMGICSFFILSLISWISSSPVIAKSCINFLGYYDTPGIAWGVAVVGTTAYVTVWNGGLQVIDVSMPSKPKLLGNYETSDARGVAVVGTKAYVGDMESGLLVIDVSKPSKPKLLGNYAKSDARGVAVVGRKAYVADGKGLQVIDVSKPSKPKLLGNYETSYAQGVAVVGTTAYVADEEGLLVIDVSMPSKPKLLGNYETSNAQGVAVVGTTAYVTGFDSLEIMDMADCSDTDGDGLLDDWEKHGYDADGDGRIDVDLPKMGANYKHKDIFVEIDWMANDNHTHKPSATVLEAVRQSFRHAPVTNPDGVNGINIHFDIGRWGGGNAVMHDDILDPVWDEFDAIRNENFDWKKRERIFHYCLFAHTYYNPNPKVGTLSSGISRGIPASDFIVSLGSWDNQVGTMTQQAGTLMHELGHNLGLKHGGNDAVNNKPNFLSIMNYLFQMDWLRYEGSDKRLDYSRLDIEDLYKNALSEKKGLDQVGGDTSIKKYGTRYYDSYGYLNMVSQSYENVDWDGDGTVTSSLKIVDINNDPIGKNVLTGHCKEWDKIVYNGGSIGGGLKAIIPKVSEPYLEPCLTFEEYHRMKKSTVETK